MIEPAQITPEWVAEHVDPGVALDGAIAWERIGEGGGLLGRIYRVQYTAGEERSFVLKLPPPAGSAWDHLLAQLEVFRREAQSYRLLEQARAHELGLVPSCYWSSFNDRGFGALALEDLTIRGGFNAHVADGLTRAQTEATLVTLAHLHALHACDGVSGEADRPPGDWMYTAWSSPLVQILTEAIRDGRICLAKELGNDAHEPLLTAMARWRVEPTLEQSHRNARLFSVCHADIWSNNIMFVPTSDRAERAVVLDWQFTTWGNPLVDVAFLLVSSLTPERREAWTPALVDLYHSTLRANLDPAIPYTLEDCRVDYARALPYGVLMSLCNVEAFLSSVDEHEAPAIVRRLAAAGGRLAC